MNNRLDRRQKLKSHIPNLSCEISQPPVSKRGIRRIANGNKQTPWWRMQLDLIGGIPGRKCGVLTFSALNR
jgi:hypothetical protein